MGLEEVRREEARPVWRRECGRARHFARTRDSCPFPFSLQATVSRLSVPLKITDAVRASPAASLVASVAKGTQKGPESCEYLVTKHRFLSFFSRRSPRPNNVSSCVNSWWSLGLARALTGRLERHGAHNTPPLPRRPEQRAFT